MTWYRDLKFATNPLDIRPNQLLVGLEEEEDRLKNHIQKEEVCFLNGLTGSGKTSMLKRVQKELKGHKFIYLDAQDLPTNFNLEGELQSKRGFLDKLTLRKFPKKKPVLIIDEFQDTDKNLVLQARSNWESPGNRKIRAIVIAQISKHLKNCTDSFKERIGNRMVVLPSLDDDQLKEVIKNRLFNKKTKTNWAGKLSEEALDLLVFTSGGNPRRLLEHADLLFDFHHQRFSKINPMQKDDYKITYYAAKEILDVNGINTKGFDKDMDAMIMDKGVTFEKMYTIEERKVLKMLQKNGPKTYRQISMSTKMTLAKVKSIIGKLKKKHGVKQAGKKQRQVIWDMTPQAKRLTVRV